MTTERDDSSAKELVFRLKRDCVAMFFQLLSRGFIVRAEVGCSVRSFLYSRMKLTPDFVEDRITTIFLNGKPVDDIDSATVRDGCTLALSSAMPGLVGATMRRGGYYASLRSQISHSAEKGIASVTEGFVTLKLFNLVASELGPAVLESGIMIGGADLEDFLKSRQPDLEMRGVQALLDGRALDQGALRGVVRPDETVLVRLKME